jgi:tRNA (guanine-N7-)-methyltransferase
LEVGSGHGHYLTAYAAAHPSRFCLGIDIMSERLVRSERKRHRARLPNLAFVHASADSFLTALPDDVLIEDIMILFPDPWPKRRHHKHRLIQPEFLLSLAAKTLPGARLCLRTDSAEYFATARSAIAGHAAWAINPQAPWPFELPTVFQSRASAYDSLIAIRT